MDLPTPACHISVSDNRRALVATSLCGTTTVYGFPDLNAQARWALHAPIPVEQTALAQVGGAII